MTRKEQIIEILKAELQAGNIEMIHTNIEQLAEKLALPLDVPSDEEIKCDNTCKWFKIGYGHCNWCNRQYKKDGLSDNYEPIEFQKKEINNHFKGKSIKK